MIWFLLGCVVFVAVGLLVCVKHDAPESYAAFKRLFAGVLAASALAWALSFAVIATLGCNDLEKYSWPWYAMACFLWETSS